MMSLKPVIFLSCSGALSRELAGVLNDYLPQFIQAAQPFVSEADSMHVRNLERRERKRRREASDEADE